MIVIILVLIPIYIQMKVKYIATNVNMEVMILL